MQRAHPGFDQQGAVGGQDEEDGFGRFQNRPFPCHPHIIDDPGQWRADVHPLQPCQQRCAALFKVQLRHLQVAQRGDRLFAPLAVQLQALDLDLGNPLHRLGALGLGLANGPGQSRRLASQVQDPAALRQALFQELLLPAQFLFGQRDLAG